jgi:hypothetical protein
VHNSNDLVFALFFKYVFAKTRVASVNLARCLLSAQRSYLMNEIMYIEALMLSKGNLDKVNPARRI